MDAAVLGQLLLDSVDAVVAAAQGQVPPVTPTRADLFNAMATAVVTHVAAEFAKIRSGTKVIGAGTVQDFAVETNELDQGPAVAMIVEPADPGVTLVRTHWTGNVLWFVLSAAPVAPVTIRWVLISPALGTP